MPLRCRKMRGYGSWCMGWKEAERLPPGPPGNGPGIFFYCIVGLIVLTCGKVALETGNPAALLIGLGIIAGVMKS